MSLKKKLTDVATAAAIEATTNERARCLWCIDGVIRELEGKLRKKLMGEAQLHTAQTKFKIAQAVVRELRRAIVSGIRPAAQTQAAPGGPGGTDAADLSCRFCKRELSDPRGCDKEVDHVEHCGG